MAPLFSPHLAMTTPGDRFMLLYLRMLAAPTNKALLFDFTAQHSIEMMEHLERQRLNKGEERRKRALLDKVFGLESMETHITIEDSLH
jgi:hypothetical protein